jgi:geranylgeranyl pyrophosphate synthase
MVPLAAHAAFTGARRLELSEIASGRVVEELMRASGAGGMIGGQLLDLEAEGQPLALSQLERIHRAKTGTLIAASVTLGGMAAAAPADRLDALERYGRALGLAFQIADDVLDVTATTERLGKPAGRDLDLHKGTYPAVLGVPAASARAAALAEEACDALRAAQASTAELEALARFVVHRPS